MTIEEAQQCHPIDSFINIIASSNRNTYPPPLEKQNRVVAIGKQKQLPNSNRSGSRTEWQSGSRFHRRCLRWLSGSRIDFDWPSGVIILSNKSYRSRKIVGRKKNREMLALPGWPTRLRHNELCRIKLCGDRVSMRSSSERRL